HPGRTSPARCGFAAATPLSSTAIVVPAQLPPLAVAWTSARFAASARCAEVTDASSASADPRKPNRIAGTTARTRARLPIARRTGGGRDPLRLQRRGDRVSGLDFVRIFRVPGPQVGKRHRDRPVLHLPDVA